MSDASDLRMLRQSPQLLLELEIEGFLVEMVTKRLPDWPEGDLATISSPQKIHPNPLFAQFLDASRSPYGQSGKKWLPFRPENILSRALEGVVGTAAALVNQKHHLR